MEKEIMSTTDLLHPELLSKEALLSLLEQKHIKVDAAQRGDKEVLVQICLRTVTPQPQRQPRSNRRGQITAKVIKKCDAIRARSRPDGGNFSNKASKEKSEQRRRLVMSADLSKSDIGACRLKPPPVIIDKNKSIVKLNPSKSSPSETEVKSPVIPTSGVRKLKLGSSSTVSSPSNKPTTVKLNRSPTSEPKPTAKSSDLNKAKSDVTPQPSKKVSLKRPPSEENGEKPMDTSVTSPKKKIKKISWP